MWLCLDVDGTIVNRDGSVVAAAEDLIRRQRAVGWRVALCSARPMKSLMALGALVGGVDHVSGLGGAVVVDVAKGLGSTIIEPSIPRPLRMAVVEQMGRSEQLSLWAFTSDRWLVSAVDARVEREAIITGLRPELTLLSNFVIEDVMKFVVPEMEPALLACWKSASSLQSLQICYSTDLQVEVMPAGVGDKGVRLFTPPPPRGSDVVVAVGDGLNDLGMLEAADVAVTFEDAASLLRSRASIVLPRDRQQAFHLLPGLLRGHARLAIAAPSS